MRLALVAAISFALAWALCYGALRTAEAIARKQTMFVVTVKQAQMSADILNRYCAGVAVCVSGKTPKEDR